MTNRPFRTLATLSIAATLAGLGATPTASAQATRPAGATPEQVVGSIADAQGRDAYYSHAAVSMDVALTRGGKTTDYAVLFDTPVGHSRVVEKGPGGEVVKTTVFDGDKAWVTPASGVSGMERFWSLTLPYFAAAPFKMRDASVRLADAGPTPLRDGETVDAVRVTFDAAAGDAGDSPGDYYLLFPDDAGRLGAMAYIVTYRPSEDGGPPAPHAIVYGDFADVGGATLATSWTFYDWSPQAGLTGDPLFSATLSNVAFVDDVPAGTFDKPDGAAEDPLPGR